MKVLIEWKALCDEIPNTTDTIIISGPGLRPGTYGIGKYLERTTNWNNVPMHRFSISTFKSEHLAKSRYDSYSILEHEFCILYWDYYNDKWQQPRPIEPIESIFDDR